MEGVLIADAGSTKTDWIVINKENNETILLHSGGINPATFSQELIEKTIANTYSQISGLIKIKDIYFYGAGCATSDTNEILRKILNKYWGETNIFIDSDLKGAAISLFGKEEGLACILGTGSASCFVKNGEIIDRIPSLGYILGDEGSGNALGKRLLNGIYKNRISRHLVDNFQKEYHLTLSDIIQNTYKSEAVSAFLGSFVPFIYKHIDTSEIREMVREEFLMFFKHNVIPYHLNNKIKIGFVGSIAYMFKELLENVAEENGFQISKILKSPLEGLVAFHSQI